MISQRQDAWTDEHDQILAETILKHIREGSSQLKAFEEVGMKLGRTAAACGFRWNSFVRKRYEEEIVKAKEERINSGAKKKNIKLVTNENSLDTAIAIIQQYKMIIAELENKIEQLINENQELKNQIQKLNDELEKCQTPSDDYQYLIEILNRARELGALEKVKTG